MINNYIITKILEFTGTKDNKYALVISALEGSHVDVICKYVLSCAKKTCLQEYGCINFAQILNKMDADFCVARAYDYVAFLQNDHEHIDDIEHLKR